MTNPHRSHSNSASSQAGFETALQEFDDALRDRRSQDIMDLFAEDCKALIHHQDTIVGRDAVGEAFRRYFDVFPTSAYAPDYDVVDVVGDRAYVLGSFQETLRPSSSGPLTRVFGRVVLFWSRIEGKWLVTRLLTARSSPEQIGE
ncbi:MAG: nuclear transport factor 2 family protein [Chloroflexi bacterium]|nr:nuclear transport factor 2 family protein [Chloroflexota bacterium]